MTERGIDSDILNDKARDALRQTELGVPLSVQQRLAAARRAAVAEAERPQPVPWGRLAGSGALASAALVLALMLPGTGTQSLPALEEAEMAAAQNAELLEELEFVAWMLAEESADDSPGKG